MPPVLVTSLFSLSSLVIITHSARGSSCLISTLLEILSPPFQGQSSPFFQFTEYIGATQNSRQQSGNSFFLTSATQTPGSEPCSQPRFDVLARVTFFCFFPLELTELARAALFSLLFAALKNAGEATLLQRTRCQSQQWGGEPGASRPARGIPVLVWQCPRVYTAPK